MSANSGSGTCPTCGKSTRSPGRPKGSKDSAPRKTRSDKGKKRGPYKKRGGSVEA
nr:MAG TPA: tRNA pseudouridine synthase B [Caudoviricetes sp.]